jgi:hypothetical protein
VASIATSSTRVGQQRREPLHGDVIHRDAAFGQ